MTDGPKHSTQENIASPWTEKTVIEAGTSTEKSETEQSAGYFSLYIKSSKTFSWFFKLIYQS